MQVGSMLALEAAKRQLNCSIVQLGTYCYSGGHTFQGTHSTKYCASNELI